MRAVLHLFAVALLTVLTQLGGLAWLLALAFRRRLVVFLLAYAGLWTAAMVVAPSLGRVPLDCFGGGVLRLQSPLYCVLNRHYVAPELKAAAQDLAEAVDAAFPGTVTLALDGNFPFLDGFPLLPHLSHADGRKLDLAFYYRDTETYLPGRTRSPLGYFAFEPGPTGCPPARWSLRWDLDWLQPLFPAWSLEPQRTRFALETLARDPRIARIFLEPHLAAGLGVASPKIRFQGCRAARHDDHIHIEL